MSLKEKVAYLKGLAEGSGLNTESKEGKLMVSIIDTLTVMADEIDELIENSLDIGEELDAISEDLADVEKFVFDEDFDEDEFYDFDDDDFDDDDFDDGMSDTGDDIDDIYKELMQKTDTAFFAATPDSASAGAGKVCDNDCHCDLCSANAETFDVTCPVCNAEIELDESDLSKDSINCPKCNELLEFEFDDED